MSLPPFHLAFPVDDLAAARRFYGELLGCPEGRSAEHWVDFDLYGHQIVAHLAPDAAPRKATNPVDGEAVPVPHFEGQPGEQATMFLLDPAGNALEFKAMADPAKLFATS